MENVEVIEITPNLARQWLGFNTHNRKLRQRVVAAYAADMRAGDWQWNGESIKFAADGTLLDGQHRLAAIAEAEATVKMLTVRGLPNHTQDTVDGGAKRKFSDVLTLRGERAAVPLASITRRVAMWEAGARKDSSAFAPTNAQMLQTLEKYPDLRRIALEAQRVARLCTLPASIIGQCWWLFDQINSEDADFFFARLADGQNLAKGDAIYELLRTIRESRSVRGERSTTFLAAVTIKAWNAYRDGAKINLLRYRPGGSNPERFPEPH